MIWYASQRLAQAAFVLGLVSVVAFGLFALAPLDPARMALSAGGTGVAVDAEDLAQKRRELGLDQPLWQRYVRWWHGLIHGDLGRSFMSNQPVVALVLTRLPASLVLAGLALSLSVGTALPLGLWVAWRAHGRLDQFVRVGAALALALPGFWLALLAMWLFAATLHWVPALGSFTPRGLILPVLILALRPWGRFVRLVRATTLDLLGQPYIQVARSKGLSETTILRRHVLPNALPPLLTVVGLDWAALLANSAVIEWVFAWPGIGRLGVEAALNGDLPVLMGFVFIVGTLVLMVHLVIDWNVERGP